MKSNEIKNPYLAPQVKVVKVAVERGFAGSTPQSIFALWLLADGKENSSQSLEERSTDGNWGGWY